MQQHANLSIQDKTLYTNLNNIARQIRCSPTRNAINARVSVVPNSVAGLADLHKFMCNDVSNSHQTWSITVGRRRGLLDNVHEQSRS